MSMFKFFVHSFVTGFASVTFPFTGCCPCTQAMCTHVLCSNTISFACVRGFAPSWLARGQGPGQYRPGRCPRDKQTQTPVCPGIVRQRHILSTFVDSSPVPITSQCELIRLGDAPCSGPVQITSQCELIRPGDAPVQITSQCELIRPGDAPVQITSQCELIRPGDAPCR